jgi:site-specific DNA recombinase
MVIKDIYNHQSGPQSDGRKELLIQIETESNRLTKARKLLLDDAIDSADYKKIKLECEQKLVILEGKLTGFCKPTYDLDGCVDKALFTFPKLNISFLEADTTAKRNIIGSIFPEKLCFDGTAYRTARVNEAAHLLYLINSKLVAKKIGQNLIFQACPIR